MLKRKTLFYYGFLGLPLAFIGLPIYVYLQKVYHEQYGLSLTYIGLILFFTKTIDMVIDPFLGIELDKLNLRKIYRKKIIYICLPLLALSFNFLFFPPFSTAISLLIFSLTTYIIYSIILINFYAISVEMTSDYREQNRISGTREIFGLIGLLFATVFPVILMQKYGFVTAYNSIVLILVFMLFSAGIFLHFVKAKPHFMFHSEMTIKLIFNILTSNTHGKFLLVLLLNSISTTIPAMISLFYIEYVIKAEEYTGYFFLTYFLCGIISIPFWTKYSSNFGKKNAWIVSMIFSSMFFSSSFFLGEGDVKEYFIVCLLTGVCLGADLCLPPSLYSDSISKLEKSASYYSLWSLTNKAALAIASLIALVVLGYYGFNAKALLPIEREESGIFALSVIYCLIPSIFRIAAMILLLNTKIDAKFKNIKII